MSCFRIWILRMQWWLLRRPSVILLDHDGEANARLVHGCFRGYRFAKRFSGGSIVQLLPNGKTSGLCFVVSWEPMFGVALSQQDRT